MEKRSEPTCRNLSLPRCFLPQGPPFFSLWSCFRLGILVPPMTLPVTCEYIKYYCPHVQFPLFSLAGFFKMFVYDSIMFPSHYMEIQLSNIISSNFAVFKYVINSFNAMVLL